MSKETTKCRTCGCEVELPWLVCEECIEKHDKEYYTEVKYSEYTGRLYDPLTGKIHKTKEELYLHRDKEARTWGGTAEYPERCYGSILLPFQISMESELINIWTNGQGAEFSREDIVDLEEFKEFIDKWNKKQTAKIYDGDDRIIVLLNE